MRTNPTNVTTQAGERLVDRNIAGVEFGNTLRGTESPHRSFCRPALDSSSNISPLTTDTSILTIDVSILTIDSNANLSNLTADLSDTHYPFSDRGLTR